MKSSRQWLEERLGVEGAEVMVRYVEGLEASRREWASGERLHHVHVDRVARYIWRSETSDEDTWSRKLGEYRERARRVLSQKPDEAAPMSEAVARADADELLRVALDGRYSHEFVGLMLRAKIISGYETKVPSQYREGG